jgi:hypothetical protein
VRRLNMIIALRFSNRSSFIDAVEFFSVAMNMYLSFATFSWIERATSIHLCIEVPEGKQSRNNFFELDFFFAQLARASSRKARMFESK